MRRLGIGIGCLLAAYLAVAAFGLATGTQVPLTPWPEAKPSARGAQPGHDALTLEQGPPESPAKGSPGSSSSGSAPPGVAPGPGGPHSPASTHSGTSPAAHASATPTAGATTAAPSASATAHGKSHAYGRTKSPHPRRP